MLWRNVFLISAFTARLLFHCKFFICVHSVQYVRVCPLPITPWFIEIYIPFNYCLVWVFISRHSVLLNKILLLIFDSYLRVRVAVHMSSVLWLVINRKPFLKCYECFEDIFLRAFIWHFWIIAACYTMQFLKHFFWKFSIYVHLGFEVFAILTNACWFFFCKFKIPLQIVYAFIRIHTFHLKISGVALTQLSLTLHYSRRIFYYIHI